MIIDKIRQILRTLLSGELADTQMMWLAFSGGVDSAVLLHAMHQLQDEWRIPLQALHINHGLHPEADNWQRHCELFCDSLGVPLSVVSVEIATDSHYSIEEAARDARYRVFSDKMDRHDLLLMAHHQNDQVETLLMRLLQGAGVKGLSGMPLSRGLGRGSLVRPLLDVSRQEIEDWARDNRLAWVEDPSNLETHFERNYIRHEVLPGLQQRRSGVMASLLRVCQHQAEAQAILDEVAQSDSREAQALGATMDIPSLLRLRQARQHNLLRYWLGANGMPMPSTQHLGQILEQICQARSDAMPVMHWPWGSLRRYRETLHIVPPDHVSHQEETLRWHPGDELCLPGGVLTSVQVQGHGLAQQFLADGPVEIRFRQGGEKIVPAGRGVHKTLKALFQERGIPPWQREQTPLLYIGGKLAVVAGLCVHDDFVASAEEQGWHIGWRPA